MVINQQQIVQLFKEGKRQIEISRLTGVRPSWVYAILRNHEQIPFPRSRLDKNTVKKIRWLYKSGKPVSAIVNELNVTNYDVTVVLKKKFRTSGESLHLNGINNAPEVDESTKQLILGSLLGDASISKSMNRSYYIRISHTEKQRGYTEYLTSKLGVKIHESYYESSTFSKVPFKVYKLTYKNARFLKYLESVVLMDGKKKVSQKWLNELGLEGIAYWFMDDGSSTWCGNSVIINFSTLGFDAEENKLLAEKLTSMGYLTRIRLDHRKYNGPGLFLSMSMTVTQKFMEDIKQYVWPIECMRYKIKLKADKHIIL
jgi:hypothetical protein